MPEAPISCPACGRPKGSNAECFSCRDAAARELAGEAKDITDQALAARAEAGRRFEEDPPWYARFAPKNLMPRLRLLWMMASDYARGSYRKVPWKTMAITAGAIAYVISPLDIIPDVLIPVGWTDDMLVLGIAWTMIKRELREYCAWKGLSPTHFNL